MEFVIRTIAAFAISVALIFVTLILVPEGTAHAQQASKGQQAIDLERECNGRGSAYSLALEAGFKDLDFFSVFDVARCNAYLSGIVDAMAYHRGVLKKSLFCFPQSGISGEQQIRIFLSWTKKHPELLHESRRQAVIIAFNQAFPCRK